MTEDVRVMLDENEPKGVRRIEFATPHTTLSVDVLCAKEGNPGALQSGMWLWPAAQALGSYLCDKSAELGLDQVQTCMELGAGAGLTGLCLAHLLSSTTLNGGGVDIILTDRDYTSLRIMKASIALNAPRWNPKQVSVSTRRFLFVDGTPNEAQLKAGRFAVDLIIGTDLIYSDAIARNLIQTLKCVFLMFCCRCWGRPTTNSWLPQASV
jgi:hypothetical protein